MRFFAILPTLALLFTTTVLAGTVSVTTGSNPKNLNCKGPVVYAVSDSKTYYEKGESMYGHAKGGTYMCQAAANAAGYHHVSNAKNAMKADSSPKPHR